MGADENMPLPGPKRRGEAVRADEFNELVAGLKKLNKAVAARTIQDSPDVGARRGDGGVVLWLKGGAATRRGNCRFQITVDDKIRVGPGVILYQRRGKAGIVIPHFPKLNGVFLVADGERPGFPVAGLEADTKYRVILRYNLNGCDRTIVEDSGDDGESKIELLEPGEDPDLDDDERAVLIGEVTLQDGEDVLVAKTIKQILGSDYLHACSGADDDDSNEGSSDEDLSLSDDPSGDSSDLSLSGSESSLSSGGSDGSSNPPDPGSCMVAIGAKWVNKPSCVRKPVFGTTRPFQVTFEVIIEITNCDACKNWWSEVSLLGWEPVESQLPDEAEISGSGVRFPIGCGGSYYVTFKVDPYVPCATAAFSVQVKPGGPADSSEPDACCKQYHRSVNIKTPGWCDEGCTTIGTMLPP